MPTVKADPSRHVFRLQTLKLLAPWEALLLPVSRFPMPEPERALARRFLERLASAVRVEWRLASEVLVHMAKLAYEDGSGPCFSKHGREWLPKLGLGVWPDRDPPTIWTRADFDSLGPGEHPRTLRNHVFRITRSAEAQENSRATMLGWGSVLQVMVQGDPQAFYAQARETLLPSIQDPSFNCFPFYVPLLEGKSLTEARPSELASRFCGASVYIRESPEDAAVLIASRESLEPVLRKLGGKLEPGPPPAWRFEG